MQAKTTFPIIPEVPVVTKVKVYSCAFIFAMNRLLGTRKTCPLTFYNLRYPPIALATLILHFLVSQKSLKCKKKNLYSNILFNGIDFFLFIFMLIENWAFTYIGNKVDLGRCHQQFGTKCCWHAICTPLWCNMKIKETERRKGPFSVSFIFMFHEDQRLTS